MAAGTVSRASRLASVVAWVTPSPASKPRAPTAPEPVPTWGIKYDKTGGTQTSNRRSDTAG